MVETKFPRLDKSAFKIFSSFEEVNREDKEYWHASTPQERLQYMELLRRINHGSAVIARLQRVLDIAERP